MVVLRYPYSQRLLEDLSEEEIRLKIARHSPCSYCNCAGLHPTADDEIIPDDGGAAEDVSMLESCDCGHDVVDHGNSGDYPHSERVRRAKVAIRLDELLEVCPSCVFQGLNFILWFAGQGEIRGLCIHGLRYLILAQANESHPGGRISSQ